MRFDDKEIKEEMMGQMETRNHPVQSGYRESD